MIPENNIDHDIKCIMYYVGNLDYTDLASEFFHFVAKRTYMNLDNLMRILTTIKNKHISLELSLAKFFKALSSDIFDGLEKNKDLKRLELFELLNSYEFFYIGIVILKKYFKDLPNFNSTLQKIIPAIMSTLYVPNVRMYYEELFILKSTGDEQILCVYYENFVCAIENSPSSIGKECAGHWVSFLLNEFRSDSFKTFVKEKHVAGLFKAMDNLGQYELVDLFIDNVSDEKIAYIMHRLKSEKRLADKMMPLE